MKNLFAVLVLSVISICSVSAQTANHKNQFNVDKSALAIEGYDPVAYFTSSKPIKGKKEFNLTAEGVTYQFANAQNKNTFKANPAKYEPQYGGWCAYAMGATGEKVSVDPETYKIINGKLFLFYNRFFNNTLKDWNKDESNLKINADKSWAKFNP
ncbi:YHS domain protein [Pedobacter sp. PAMC26386]|nr:YHS domain protein [Pedobacter sp. PAMC26386]